MIRTTYPLGSSLLLILGLSLGTACPSADIADLSWSGYGTPGEMRSAEWIKYRTTSDITFTGELTLSYFILTSVPDFCGAYQTAVQSGFDAHVTFMSEWQFQQLMEKTIKPFVAKMKKQFADKPIPEARMKAFRPRPMPVDRPGLFAAPSMPSCTGAPIHRRPPCATRVGATMGAAHVLELARAPRPEAAEMMHAFGCFARSNAAPVRGRDDAVATPPQLNSIHEGLQRGIVIVIRAAAHQVHTTCVM